MIFNILRLRILNEENIEEKFWTTTTPESKVEDDTQELRRILRESGGIYPEISLPGRQP